MDKKYIELFKTLAQATAVSAEQVMEYDSKKGDKHGAEVAETMRNDYQDLTDAITNAGDNYVPSKSDAARLLVGAMVQANQLPDRIKALKTALTGYQTDLIPKLQEIVEKAETDEDVANMANEKFVIVEETNT